MDIERKVQLLNAQIADAKAGYPDDLSGWRNKADVVLRTVLGEDTPLHKKFKAVKYSPQVMYSGMDTSGYRPAGVRSAISILESAKLEIELAAEVEATVQPSRGGEVQNKTFIVHGHDDTRKHELARFLLRVTGEEPVILHEQPNKGRVLIEKFEQSAAGTGFAVVLLTADDLGRAKRHKEDQPRGRQNVVFEMGFFFGALGRERVAVLYEEGVEIIGDVNGLVYVALDAAGAWRTELASELDAAGLPVNWEALGK